MEEKIANNSIEEIENESLNVDIEATQKNIQSQDEIGGQTALPNSVLVLIFGILAIVLFKLWGVGVIFGIISLAISSNSKKQYNKEPEIYILSSYKRINAGRICAIIGILLSLIIIIRIIMVIYNDGH
jgi:hypothetical protein